MSLSSKFSFNILLTTALFLIGCDPGHTGKTFIRNDSAFTLQLTYQTHTEDTTMLIEPYSLVDVYHFGGLGDGRFYSNCSAEFSSIALQPTDTSRTMTRDITDPLNWDNTNPNKKRFSNKEITCEFVVTQADIQ